MEQRTNNLCLLEVVEKINSFDRSHTIYAAHPWTFTSQAIVALEPDTGKPPLQAEKEKLDYFLEIFIAEEVLENYPTALPKEKCERLIQYAENDA